MQDSIPACFPQYGLKGGGIGKVRMAEPGPRRNGGPVAGVYTMTGNQMVVWLSVF